MKKLPAKPDSISIYNGENEVCAQGEPQNGPTETVYDTAFKICVQLLRRGGTAYGQLPEPDFQTRDAERSYHRLIVEIDRQYEKRWPKITRHEQWKRQDNRQVILACCYVLAVPSGAFRRSGSRIEQHSYRLLKTSIQDIEQAIRLIRETHSLVHAMDWLYGLPGFYENEAEKKDFLTCMKVLVMYPQRVLPALEQIKKVTRRDLWRNEVLFFLVEHVTARMQNGSEWKGPPWRDLAEVISALGKETCDPDALRVQYQKIKRQKAKALQAEINQS